MKKNKLFATKLKKAIELLEADEIVKALKIFEELYEEQPTNVSVLLGMAQCLDELGETDDALDILNTILAEFPDNDIAILLKTMFLKNVARVQEAILFLEDKINSGFKDPEGYALQGELYLIDNRPILAITALQNALGFPSLLDRKTVSNNLANCYREIGNYKRASKIFEDLLNIYPDDARVLFNKAILLKEKNDLSECKKILLLNTSLNPEFLEAWIMLATLYEELGESDKSQECIDRIKEIISNQKQ